MKKSFHLLLLMLLLSLSYKSNSQTVKPKDVIISSFIPDNILGRYNLGVEYYFNNKKDSTLNPISVFINGGKTSSTILNQKIEGIDFTGEINLYNQVLMSNKWNEYLGLKINYGKFENETTNEKKNSYFIGISTGMQPLILKRIALRINSDIGYTKNGLASLSFFGNNNEIFITGFTINFSLAVGVRF